MRKLSHLPKKIRQLADGYSIWPLRNNLLSNEIRRIKHNPMEARMVPEAGFVENIREFLRSKIFRGVRDTYSLIGILACLENKSRNFEG